MRGLCEPTEPLVGGAPQNKVQVNDAGPEVLFEGMSREKHFSLQLGRRCNCRNTPVTPNSAFCGRVCSDELSWLGCARPSAYLTLKTEPGR